MYSFYYVATGFKVLLVFFPLAVLEITLTWTVSLSCSRESMLTVANKVYIQTCS